MAGGTRIDLSKKKNRILYQPMLASAPQICTCKCMISFATDSVGAVDDACVGGLVGEGGSATKSSVSE